MRILKDCSMDEFSKRAVINKYKEQAKIQIIDCEEDEVKNSIIEVKINNYSRYITSYKFTKNSSNMIRKTIEQLEAEINFVIKIIQKL